RRAPGRAPAGLGKPLTHEARRARLAARAGLHDAALRRAATRRYEPSTMSVASRLDQSAPDRVAGELDAVAHAELVEDVLSVALDRLDADHELARDLLRGVRLRDQLQDLQLARRQ